MNYKSILCLNGELPQKDFFNQFDLPVIAADGATNQLQALKIIPKAIIGDLDSVLYQEQLDSEIIYIEDQAYCDFEKSMFYLEKNKLLPTIIVGIGGGNLDHILNNISIFMSYPSGNLLYSPPLYGTIISSHTCITLPIDTKVSIIGLPKARLFTRGLIWDLTGQLLHFPGNNSCLNRMKDNFLYLQVLKGQVLFLAHAPFDCEPQPNLLIDLSSELS